DDLQPHTGLVPYARDEILAVGGETAGFRGDAAQSCDAPPAHLARTDPERRDRAIDRFLRKPPGRLQALSEPHDPRKGIDDLEGLVGRPRYQKAAIVSAEVEGRIQLILS